MIYEGDVISIVSRHLGVSREEMCSASKQQSVCDAKHVAMYFIRKRCHATYERIGRIFGRDHAVVMYACKKVVDISSVDAEYRKMLAEIEVSINRQSSKGAEFEARFARGELAELFNSWSGD